jgi:hypothetical protein
MTDTEQSLPTTRAYRVLRLARTALGVLVAVVSLLRLLGWL